MNPEVKAKWLAGLRDPKNQQAKGVLKQRNGSRCCIGVLTEIVAPGSLVWDRHEKAYLGPDSNRGRATADVLRAAGISQDIEGRLIARNDGEQCFVSGPDAGLHFAPHSFSQIADFIEREL